MAMKKFWPFFVIAWMIGCGPPEEPGPVDAGVEIDPRADDIPDNAYCEGVKEWSEDLAILEDLLLESVNEVRAQGGNCRSQGTYPPTHPLEMEPALRCAARVHSLDMDERQYFSHDSPTGETAWYRIAQAGFGSSPVGENIAMGSSTVEGVMAQWLNSDGHCANIFNSNYYYMGAGVYEGDIYRHIWTQTFGGNF